MKRILNSIFFCLASSIFAGVEFTINLKEYPLEYKIYDALMGPITRKEINVSTQENKKRSVVLELQICRILLEALSEKKIILNDIPICASVLQNKLCSQLLRFRPKQAIALDDLEVLNRSFYNQQASSNSVFSSSELYETPEVKALLRSSAQLYKKEINKFEGARYKLRQRKRTVPILHQQLPMLDIEKGLPHSTLNKELCGNNCFHIRGSIGTKYALYKKIADHIYITIVICGYMSLFFALGVEFGVIPRP